MLAPAEFLALLFLFTVVVFSTIFWIWMLIDCTSKERSDGNDKLVWVIIIAVTHVIGAVVYFFVRRPRRRAELGI